MNDLEKVLKMIHEAKQNYMQGNDPYEDLQKIDIFISKKLIESGHVDKMSKS